MGSVARAGARPSILIESCSGVTRRVGSVTVLPLTVTRPAAISSRASERLAKPSFDSARANDTPPPGVRAAASRRSFRAEADLPVVAKLQCDSEIFRSQRLHRALQIVFRR